MNAIRVECDPCKLSIAVLKNPKDMIFFVAYPSRTKQLFEIKKV